jgi:hypothetical protein
MASPKIRELPVNSAITRVLALIGAVTLAVGVTACGGNINTHLTGPPPPTTATPSAGMPTANPVPYVGNPYCGQLSNRSFDYARLEKHLHSEGIQEIAAGWADTVSVANDYLEAGDHAGAADFLRPLLGSPRTIETVLGRIAKGINDIPGQVQGTLDQSSFLCDEKDYLQALALDHVAAPDPVAMIKAGYGACAVIGPADVDDPNQDMEKAEEAAKAAVLATGVVTSPNDAETVVGDAVADLC